ncbi:MAG: type 1 glutamine amidotransferase [Phycisphaeraceae bacterium]|nr:type 1 glutamine amidotransferase [Phycisphaeraceae bacterium]
MTILLCQHDDMCRSGRLGLTLRDQGHRFDIRRLNRGDALPHDLDGYTAVISMGGPQNIGDDAAWMERECKLLRAAHAMELPIVGVCLGAQLVAHALGGEVASMEKPEVGFPDVMQSPSAQTDPIYAGMAWTIPQFSHHSQEVSRLPDGATLLSSSAQCKAQSFRVGVRTYAFQHHFECDRPMVADLIRAYPKTLQLAGLTEAQCSKEADEKYQFFARQSDRLSVNLATCLMPAGARLGAIPA